MAQTGYTPILIYSSSTASQAPSASNLTNSTLGSELAINITDGKLFYKDNANAVQVIGWKTVPTSAGGTGLTSYTAGDTVYYASGTTLSKLAIGASKTIMTSSGTAPQWSASLDTSQGGTGVTSYTAGDLTYYASGTAFTKLAIGTAYQALQVNAGATAPSWQPSATSVLTTQGDLLYASAANTLARLAKNTTATRYLSNTGTSNNPAWAQVDLTNGVTGTLPVGNGGTGLTTYTANAFVYASGTTTLATSANFTNDGTNVGIGTSGTLYGRVQAYATALTVPSFLAQQSSANGCVYYADNYYQNMNLMSIGVEYSSGALMLGACVKPKTTNTGFISTQSLFSTYGAAVVMDAGGSAFKVYGSDTSSTVAVNSDRSLSLRFQILQAGNTAPGADNAYNCGTAALRWANIYAANGTINTSDAREKTPVDAMTANEINAAKQLAKEIGTFKFLKSIADKGNQARTHIGMTVQRAIEIMENNGLDPMKYGFICYDQWDDQYDYYPAVPAQDAVIEDGKIIQPAIEARKERSIKTIDAGDHYGFRFEELLLFIARGFEERLAALESK